MEHIGILTEVDMAAFAAYCQAYSRWKAAEEFISKHGSIVKTPSGYWQQVPQVSIAQQYMKQMTKLSCEQFGLTPASRSRIVADTKRNEYIDENGCYLRRQRMTETRPADYPRLEEYAPTRFMLPVLAFMIKRRLTERRIY